MTARRPTAVAVSARMQGVQAPVIPIIGQLIRSCPGTISLGQGIVSYGPPPECLEALQRFGKDADDHRYGPVEGLPELVERIRTKLAQDNGIDVRAERRVVVTAGGNMGFMNVVLAITDPGDEVILPVPFYFNHDMAIVMAGCRTVAVATDANYQLDLDALERAITPRTRAIATVSPNNPTGAVYSGGHLAAVNALCRERGLYHIHDEAYEYFTYGTAVHVSPSADDRAAGHTISLFSLSKAYGFASWRIGYMLAPVHLFDAINKIQDTNLICPPTVSQRVAVAALQVGRDYCRPFVQKLGDVRALVRERLATIHDICEVPDAHGAFYFLLRVRSPLSAFDVAKRLIEEHGVAVIPGDAFGVHDGCSLRVSYGALQAHTVAEGIDRLVLGLRAITSGLAGGRVGGG